MSKVILHIDLNAFFVRCEEIKDPSIIGKPVIIGHSGRGGIVSTCSYAAREYGVHSGMPTYKALLLCKDAILIPGESGNYKEHYDFYERKSFEFISFVKRYTNLVEQASIDECYVDITNVIQKYKDPIAFLKKLQADLYKETQLKCSIGVAPTKFLAKMASDMQKPMGLVVIRRKDVRKMIDPLPIEDFFGIGKKTAPHLRDMGINTIGDLAKRVNDENDDEIKRELGKFYFAIKDWINGYGSDVVNVEPIDPKSIGHSTTLPHDTNDIEELKYYIDKMAKAVSEDAIKADKIGKSVQIVLKDDEFKVINRQKPLKECTNKFEEISSEAKVLLEKNYQGQNIRLVGVTLQNLKDPGEVMVQLSIFDNYEEIKEASATRLLIGELNRAMNKSVFKTAGDYLREKKYGTK